MGNAEASLTPGYWGELLKWALAHPNDFLSLYGHVEAIFQAPGAREAVEAFKALVDLLVGLWESFPRPQVASVMSDTEVSALEAEANVHPLLGERIGKLREWLPLILEVISLLERLFGAADSE